MVQKPDLNPNDVADTVGKLIDAIRALYTALFIVDYDPDSVLIARDECSKALEAAETIYTGLKQP